jgi:hypothetical protein
VPSLSPSLFFSRVSSSGVARRAAVSFASDAGVPKNERSASAGAPEASHSARPPPTTPATVAPPTSARANRRAAGERVSS